MKAIVFGGSGFLGSHVADELYNEGYEVTIFDLNPSPYLKSEYEMIIGDIHDKKKVADAIEGMDYVFHYAGLADIGESGQKPIETARTNIMSTLYILDACVKNNISRFM